MALPSSGTSSTTLCNHCERNVPASNFDLHHAHCIRNLERCTVCGDMIPKSRAKEHYQDTHAPVACSKCGDSIERELLLIHERDKCLQRIVVCGYCDFPLPAVELNTHLEICGNRTELCHPCGKYVRLCEKLAHDLQFHEENSEASGVSSRDQNGENGHSSSDLSQRVPRDRPRDVSNRKFLFTLAITGIAIIIGSFVLQRRNTNQQQ
ncbi:hypothetical protein SUGI_0206890 [Cryptomeria japonica]|uniref:uncharacterized protein LOC131032764 isoform X1 n=1 Tax=Cryptomeria japonica TaxID=3369 RepID=UPI002408E474|nr:uncharacterized protein LOC131032764 isoform X1 [Cryptomeria japonica]GLJ13171.1 hypothetical protein SUGI_0206890 [Cryptomeria japonica]